MMKMKYNIDKFVNELKRLEVLQESYEERKKFLEEELNKFDIELYNYNSIKDVFVKVMAKQREYLKSKIEKLVTYGLQDIFEEDIEFKIDFDVKRNKLWAEFYIIKNGMKEKLQNQGGGIINVVSFLLRVLFIKLLGLEPVLVLDEAFSMVSRNYIPRLVYFIKKINKDLGIQLIIVSHHPEFEEIADEVVDTNE